MPKKRIHLHLDRENVEYAEALQRSAPSEIGSFQAAVNRIIREHREHMLGARLMQKVASASK